MSFEGTSKPVVPDAASASGVSIHPCNTIGDIEMSLEPREDEEQDLAGDQAREPDTKIEADDAREPDTGAVREPDTK